MTTETNTETKEMGPVVVIADAEHAVVEPPSWLRARSAGGGNTMTIPADHGAVLIDDRKRFDDPSKGKNRVLVRLTLREGQGATVVPGGHIVFGGVNAPIAMWPEELAALEKHYLTDPEREQIWKDSCRAFEFEVARQLRVKLVECDQAWNQATAQEIHKMIADGSGDVGFKLLEKELRATMAESPQAMYFQRTEECVRLVLAIEVLEQSMPVPVWAPESQRAAQADAIGGAIRDAFAPIMQAIAANQKGSKS